MYMLFRLFGWTLFIAVVVAAVPVVAVTLAFWYLGKAFVALFDAARS